MPVATPNPAATTMFEYDAMPCLNSSLNTTTESTATRLISIWS
jgi:hypothetical protein